MSWVVLLVTAGGVTLVALLVLLYVASLVSTNPKPFSLSGAHVVVTGGSSGIGKSIAIECFKQGAFITLIARNESRLLEAKKEMEKYSINDKQGGCPMVIVWAREKILSDQTPTVGLIRRVLPDLAKTYLVQYPVNPVVHCVSVDVSKDYTNVERVLKQAQEKLGPVDMLVNCAGMSVNGKFENLDISRFEQLMAVNYLGSVYPTRAVVATMKERRMGRIVFVSSQAGQAGLFGWTAYSSSKFALRGLAEALQMEVKPYNIHVTVAYPPDTDTPGFAEESKTKILETRMLSELSHVYQADHVARVIVKDAIQGKFGSSFGTDGHMLTVLTSGMSPVSSIGEAVEAMICMGFFRFISLYYLASFDSIIRRCMLQKENAEKTD